MFRKIFSRPDELLLLVFKGKQEMMMMRKEGKDSLPSGLDWDGEEGALPRAKKIQVWYQKCIQENMLARSYHTVEFVNLNTSQAALKILLRFV